MSVPQDLLDRFVAAGQEHVFRFLDAGRVPAEQVPAFIAQLEGLDLEYVSKSYRRAVEDADSLKQKDALSPPDEFASVKDTPAEEVAAWDAAGLEAVRKGEVAACILAGGQGTRLGFDGPKGAYDIGLLSRKPLFQLFAERLRRLASLAAIEGSAPTIPFLVMTSPGNHDFIVSFFADHGYFGLAASAVWFFVQGTMPCLTPEGKIILESAGKVATNPDGNGGFYPALHNSGCLARLQSEGVKYLHVFSVDNAVCRPADPRFVGYFAAREADCGNKCVWKVSPEERVGVMAKRDGRPCVVEYTEIDEERMNLRDASGRLVYGAGNICNHLFSVAFLAEVVIPGLHTLFHLAHKKIPHADDSGVTVQPSGNNGLKLEAFIFDTFPMSRKMAILETLREDEFSPVKNAPGAATDSPDTARAIATAQARRWVVAAGGTISGDDDALLEVSPLLSLAGEGLEERVRGQTITVPCYLDVLET